MIVELPDGVTLETLNNARAAVSALNAAATLPDGMSRESVGALLDLVTRVAEAAAEDTGDLDPTEAALRLGVARPTVMRLIARGELSSRKAGGHYFIAPREVRSYRTRLALVRREALGDLSRMAEEFGF